MREPEKQLFLRVVEIARDALDAIADEIRATDVETDSGAVFPVQRRIALYTAIEAAGPDGMKQSDLRRTAHAVGYTSLADTKVYYRKSGTPHLMKTEGYRTMLTEAGRAWLRKKTSGSAA